MIMPIKCVECDSSSVEYIYMGNSYCQNCYRDIRHAEFEHAEDFKQSIEAMKRALDNAGR